MCMLLWPQHGWPPEIDFAEESSAVGSAAGRPRPCTTAGATPRSTTVSTPTSRSGTRSASTGGREGSSTCSTGTPGRAISGAEVPNVPMHLGIQTHVGTNGNTGLDPGLDHAGEGRPADRLGQGLPLAADQSIRRISRNALLPPNGLRIELDADAVKPRPERAPAAAVGVVVPRLGPGGRDRLLETGLIDRDVRGLETGAGRCRRHGSGRRGRTRPRRAAAPSRPLRKRNTPWESKLPCAPTSNRTHVPNGSRRPSAAAAAAGTGTSGSTTSAATPTRVACSRQPRTWMLPFPPAAVKLAGTGGGLLARGGPRRVLPPAIGSSRSLNYAVRNRHAQIPIPHPPSRRRRRRARGTRRGRIRHRRRGNAQGHGPPGRGHEVAGRQGHRDRPRAQRAQPAAPDRDQPARSSTGSPARTKPCDTTGTATASGFTEAKYNLEVGIHVVRILRDMGATVIMTHGEHPAVGAVHHPPRRDRQHQPRRRRRLDPRRRLARVGARLLRHRPQHAAARRRASARSGSPATSTSARPC